MLIKKKRILSDKFLSRFNIGKDIYIKVKNVDKFEKELELFGFENNCCNGAYILPKAINCYIINRLEK